MYNGAAKQIRVFKVNQSMTITQAYREYEKEFPKVLIHLRTFFHGKPERILRYNDLNRIYDLLYEAKRYQTKIKVCDFLNKEI